MPARLSLSQRLSVLSDVTVPVLLRAPLHSCLTGYAPSLQRRAVNDDLIRREQREYVPLPSPFVRSVVLSFVTRTLQNQMQEKGKNIMAKTLRLEIEDMWTPLRDIQAEDAAIKKANEEAVLGTAYAK